MKAWRAAIGALATLGIVACSSDTVTSPPPPSLTPAQLAHRFDSLAQSLSVSSPGDIRIQWYQEMVRVLARGAAPSTLAIRAAGGPSSVNGLTEIDQFPTVLNAKVTADSTYILALYSPPLRPTAFIDVHVWFLPNGANADTTRTLVTAYLDTLGRQVTDTLEVADPVIVTERGACGLTQLSYLTVPSNPCLKATVNWIVGGGTDLLSIDPGLVVSGVHFSPTP